MRSTPPGTRPPCGRGLPDGRLRVYVYPDAASLVPILFLDYETVIDPDTMPVFYRSEAEVDAIRAKPAKAVDTILMVSRPRGRDAIQGAIVTWTRNRLSYSTNYAS